MTGNQVQKFFDFWKGDWVLGTLFINLTTFKSFIILCPGISESLSFPLYIFGDASLFFWQASWVVKRVLNDFLDFSNVSQFLKFLILKSFGNSREKQFLHQISITALLETSRANIKFLKHFMTLIKQCFQKMVQFKNPNTMHSHYNFH